MGMLLWLASLASATLPLPTYPECGEIDREDLCPSDLDEEWWLISYIPDGSRASVRPVELEMGSGCAADKAWRYSTGRFDVLLAVMDSGVNWASNKYQNKIAINTGELPLPQYADGSEAADYDLDGNGLVNIQDYSQDPRVLITAGRDVADWQLDASDLIYTFSDGTDDDGNGFVDDVAGWDFFGNDNDPYHELDEDDYGTHGDSVFDDIAAEGGDEDGTIGVCPNCAMLPLRTGDTFVTDGSRVSMAILYAADRGALGGSMALGALSSPTLVREAVAYARGKGMSLVGAAGDENAYHHNQPSVVEGIIYSHSIKSNTDDENNGVYSYFNFLNCNNYGPRVQLSADSPACATGSVAIITGIIGLVQSAAKDQGYTLSPDEVYQLLIGGADDIYLTEEELDQANTYPSGEGWDPFFGYGRVNAGRAVENVATGNVPPVGDIQSPVWFDTLDPDLGSVDIVGTVSADRSSGYTWTLEYGIGHDPRSWTNFAEGSGSSATTGTLASLDLSQIALVDVPEPELEETIVGRMERVFAPAVTVRLTVTDADGRTGEFQKTFFVQDDPDLLPGFPFNLNASGESSPNLADMNGDGVFEIVVASSGGLVYALQGDGTPMTGWPVASDVAERYHADPGATVQAPNDAFIGTAAVGDLDGDGAPEVVASSMEGKVYAWHADGSRVSGFPVRLIAREPEEFGGSNAWDNGFMAGPSLYDIDDDGKLEILAGGMDQRLYVWDSSGAPFGPYPIDVCSPDTCDVQGRRIINTPAVGDVDGDGDPDIGIGTNEAVNDGHSSVSYLFDARTGVLLDGWPVLEAGLVNTAALLPIVGEGHPGSLAFADMDGNGDLEISSPVMLGQSPIYHHDGSQYLDLPYVSSSYGAGHNSAEPSFAQMTNNPAFGDMTNDGVPEFVIGGAGTYYLIALALFSAYDFQNVVGAWDGATGAFLPGWPRQIEDLQFLVSPAIADITGDGKAEAIIGSAGYLVHAWDADGIEAEGWPKHTGGWVLGSPAVGDINGDGYIEVVVTTREGHLFAWATSGRADQAIQWASIGHDPQNTRNYETPLPTQVGPAGSTGTPGDGGCCNKNESKAGLFLIGPALWLWSRRRKSAP